MTGTATSPGTPAEAPSADLARLTAACLEAAGYQVRHDGLSIEISPTPRPGSGKRAPETRAARWTLTVDDAARARLHVVPRAAGTSDPHWIAGIAAALLTGAPASGEPGPAVPAARPAGIKAAAGLELRRRGFQVRLNTYTDDDCLELTADVSATAPGSGGREPDTTGTVYIADDGSMLFERSYWRDHAVTEWEPDYRTWLPDPSAPARVIASTITAALAAAQPGPAI